MAIVTIEQKGKKKKFTIEIEGQVVTRTTPTEYKYAILSFETYRQKWFGAFSSTIENAQKTADKDLKSNLFDRVEIIELVATETATETETETDEDIFACNHDRTGLPKNWIIACTNCGKTF